jgi:hypothetical protein
MKIKSNPILKKLKEGDVVLMRLPSGVHNIPDIHQIVKLKNLVYESEDEEYYFNWLNFEGDVLYTTHRVHISQINFIFTNCMGISEILNEFLIQKYIRDFYMFKPSENMLSDEEDELQRARIM